MSLHSLAASSWKIQNAVIEYGQEPWAPAMVLRETNNRNDPYLHLWVHLFVF